MAGKKLSVTKRPNPMQIDYQQADKWQTINDMVQKAGFTMLDIHPVIGPREESLIGSMYMMLREIQTLRSKIQNGDHPELARIEKENIQLKA